METKFWEKRAQRQEEAWQKLAGIALEKRTAEQCAEYARLDAKLACSPVDPRRLMPTPLGNLFRAAEEYPRVRYGLATSVCWPGLWLVLLKETQATLAQARRELNGAARFTVWGVALPSVFCPQKHSG